MFALTIDWKLVIGVVVIATALAFGATAVLTYRHAVNENALLKVENANQGALVIKMKARSASLKEHSADQERLSAATVAKVKRIYAERSKRDEKGNIVPAGDPVLGRLNGLFENYTAAH